MQMYPMRQHQRIQVHTYALFFVRPAGVWTPFSTIQPLGVRLRHPVRRRSCSTEKESVELAVCSFQFTEYAYMYGYRHQYIMMINRARFSTLVHEPIFEYAYPRNLPDKI